jgi:uncharacterized protein (DUF305 family)
VALVACTGRGNDGPNAADTAYATSVVTHHAQTLALLDLTLGRHGLDPRIGTFADEARGDLFAEVDATKKRLDRWGEKVPRTALEHTHGESVTYDTSIAGVLSNESMHSLEQATGPAFDRAWLRALLGHERGAVALAEEAAENGRDAAAVAAARRDEQVHADRIAVLEGLTGP